MKKYIFVLIMFLFLISCSSVGKRIVPESAVLSRNEIVQKGIEEVAKNYGEEVDPGNVGIYKKGYRDWKVILYGEREFYRVMIGEDGKINSIEKRKYSEK